MRSLACRPGRPALLPAALAACMLLFSADAAGREPGVREDPLFIAAADDEADSDSDDDGRRTLEYLPENLLRGAVGVFDSDSLAPLLVGGAAVGIGLLLDDEVRDAIADEEDALAGFAEDYLGPAGLGVVTLGLVVGGRFSENSRFRDMSYDLGVAAVVNLGYTAVLKAVVSRERPNGSNDRSFPSGHTSNAFVLASVADAHYGKNVGIPAYLLASLVGVSRLRSNAHWLSDVLAGAALGHIVGRTVVRQNSEPKDGEGSAGETSSAMPIMISGIQSVELGMGRIGSSRRTARITPILTPGFQGVQVGMRF